MNTWIFQGNPAKFKIDDYLKDYEEIWWSIRQKHFVKDVQVNDVVYIWRADGGMKGSGGLIAKCQVTQNPSMYLPNENKYWIDPPKNPYHAAKLKILEFDTENILLRSVLKSNEGLKDLLILRMANQTNYLLSPKQSHIIEELWFHKFHSLHETIHVTQTEKKAVLKTRTVQGIFRTKLLNKISKCALCNIDEPKLLLASHIKPWKDCNNTERIDINNGLLLCPNHDALFDNGLITFDEEGYVLLSNTINATTFALMNIHTDLKIKRVSSEMEQYLKWHRDNVFRQIKHE